MQIGQDTDQHEMLDDIGEVAGVKGVAIVHAALVTASCGESNCIARSDNGLTAPP
jgi:hypothetical protein